MKKIFLGLAAALMLTACNENRQPEAMNSVDSASVVTDLMMSRRSIRAYKDSVISRDTLNEILKCGIHARCATASRPMVSVSFLTRS